MDGFYKTIVLSLLCSFLLYTNTSIGSSDHEEKRFLLNKLSHDAPNKTRNYLKCMHCTGVDNPEACLDEMVCAPGQFCYIDKKFVYDLGGRMEYTAGCRSKSICHLQTCLLNASNAITKRDTEEYDSTGHSRRRSTTFLECSECCTKDRCNRKLCGFSQSQNSPRCFQCSLIDDPKKCQDETFCEDTQVCSVTAYAFIGSNGTVEKRYDQACVSNYTCSFFQKNSKTTVAPPETTTGQGVELLPPIGRRYSDRSRRYIQIAFGCCKGDLCNTFDLSGDDGDLGEIVLPDGYQCPTIAPPTTAATTAIPTTTVPTTESTTPPSTVPLTTTPTTTPTTPTTVPSTTPIPSTTTTKAAVKPTSCYLCNGPAFLCEQLYAPRQCASVTQQYCINDVTQNYDGSRTVNRRCATKDECEREWWQQTSDRAECSSYDPNQFISQEQFSCTFCCRSSLCNKNVVPDDLYVGTETQGR